MKKILLVLLALLPILGYSQNGTLDYSICQREVSYTLQGYVYSVDDNITWNYSSAYMTFSKLEISDDGEVTGKFEVRHGVINSTANLWADAVVTPKSGSRARYFMGPETSVYFPFEVKYRCFNTAPNNWVIEVDPNAVAALREGCHIRFNEDVLSIVGTNNSTFCVCYGTVPPADLPIQFQRDLVFSINGVGKCAPCTVGIRDDNAVWEPIRSSSESRSSHFDSDGFISGDTQVSVYNLSGIEVYNNKVNLAKFNLEATTLTNGIYMVKTTQPDGTVKTEKMTLSR